jgi:hypothetical protein
MGMTGSFFWLLVGSEFFPTHSFETGAATRLQECLEKALRLDIPLECIGELP